GPGTIDGKPVPGYRQEPDVPPDSTTDTFAAARFEVENWRWAGVPFYLRTGKRLPMRDTEITIQFRRAPLRLLPARQQQRPNRLTIHVQPDERISLHFHAKCPGPVVRVAPVEMSFAYSDLSGESRSTGYETLLYDCMIGDSMLFHRADMIDAAWRVATPILDVWATDPVEFPNYAAGKWGPECAEELVARDGRAGVQPRERCSSAATPAARPRGWPSSTTTEVARPARPTTPIRAASTTGSSSSCTASSRRRGRASAPPASALRARSRTDAAWRRTCRGSSTPRSSRASWALAPW